MTTLVEFGFVRGINDGVRPIAGVVSDASGSFWGTTSEGGLGGIFAGLGTVFKVHATTGALTTVHQFTGTSGPVTGKNPYSGLTSDGSGSLLGMTRNGGTGDNGTIFKFAESSGMLTTVVEFTGTAPPAFGRTPYSTLVSDGAGSFLGTTFDPNGSIFKVNPNTGALTNLAMLFGGASPAGARPYAGLVSDGTGLFWGTTSEGGASNLGVIFKINPITAMRTTVAQFTGSTGTAPGRRPYAALARDESGFFWGTTSQGGPGGNGSIFKVNASTGAVTSIVDFTGISGSAKGSNPQSALVADGSGSFLGTTYAGGTASQGTIFKVDAATGMLTTLVEFTGTSGVTKGSRPRAALVNDGRGSFWGTTEFGGTTDAGTIFRINTNGTFANVFDFTGLSSAVPGQNPGYGTLFLHSDGHLYGTTANGGVTSSGKPAGNGQIFRLRFGPTPATLPADGLSATSAVLRGTLNPNGNATTASFEWGTDPLLASFNTAAGGTTDAGTSPVAVSAQLAGLSSGTTYYFRVIGANAENAQSQRGLILSFTTAFTPLQQWKLTHLGNANAANDGDTDFDGLRTILEYATASDPLVPGALPAGSSIAGRIALTFSRDPAATDVSLTVQGSDDLVSWTDLARSTGGAPMVALVAGVTVGESGAGALRMVEVRDLYLTTDPAHPKRFLRLQAAPSAGALAPKARRQKRI